MIHMQGFYSKKIVICMSVDFDVVHKNVRYRVDVLTR